MDNFQFAPRFLPVKRTGAEVVAAARRFKSLSYDERGAQVWRGEAGAWQGRAHCWSLLVLTAREAGLLPLDECPNLLPYREAFIRAHPDKAGLASERVVKSLLCQNARMVARGQNDVRAQMRAGDILFFRFGSSSHNFHVALVADGAARHMIHAIDKTAGRKSARVDRVYEEALTALDWPFVRSVWRLNNCS